MNELVSLIKNDSGKFELRIDNLINCKNKSGVWAIFGKNILDEDYTCLEVGESNDIYEELKANLDCLQKDYNNISLRKRYTARRLFKEFNIAFDVCDCDLSRRNAKYRIIATSFVDIKIFLLAQENDQENRKRIELEFAIDNKAIFWNAWGKQRSMAKKYIKRKDLFE